MYKTLITALFSGFLFASNVYAEQLCVGLINYSNEIVEFSTVTDPGWIPVVNPGDKFILSGDFMASCSPKMGCDIVIREIKTNKFVHINKVLPGTQIVLGVNTQYYLDTKAELKCK